MHCRLLGRRTLFAVAVGALLMFARELTAQEGPPPGGGLSGMHSHGGGQGGSFDPVVFEGPPVPDSMAALVGLDGDGLARYTTMYQNLMESTKRQRDSVTSLREARRAARESGAGTGGPGGGGMGGMREIRDYLEDRQRQFDQVLQEFLTKDQFKRYAAWRDQRRHEVESEMRNRRGSPGT